MRCLLNCFKGLQKAITSTEKPNERSPLKEQRVRFVAHDCIRPPLPGSLNNPAPLQGRRVERAPDSQQIQAAARAGIVIQPPPAPGFRPIKRSPEIMNLHLAAEGLTKEPESSQVLEQESNSLQIIHFLLPPNKATNPTPEKDESSDSESEFGYDTPRSHSSEDLASPDFVPYSGTNPKDPPELMLATQDYTEFPDPETYTHKAILWDYRSKNGLAKPTRYFVYCPPGTSIQ